MSYQVSFISLFIDNRIQKIIVPQVPWKNRCHWQPYTSSCRTLWRTVKTWKLHRFPKKKPWSSSRNRYRQTQKGTRHCQGGKHQTQERTRTVPKRSTFFLILSWKISSKKMHNDQISHKNIHCQHIDPFINSIFCNIWIDQTNLIEGISTFWSVFIYFKFDLIFYEKKVILDRFINMNLVELK